MSPTTRKKILYCLMYLLVFNICSSSSLAVNSSSTADNKKTANPPPNVNYATIDVLYMIPDSIDADIFTLNEPETFGDNYKKGWVLPSFERVTLNLYLYYDGKDEKSLDTFFGIDKDPHQEVLIDDTDDYVEYRPKAELYMFFTTESHCNEYKAHRPLEIIGKIGANMYQAQVQGVSLAYSDKPYTICMQQFETGFNSQLQDSKRFFSHQGYDYWNSIITTQSLLPSWFRVVIFFTLLCLSGLFSGLNLGLMSLDLDELELLKKIGTVAEQIYATKIFPLRKRGNFLLCSILLGNVLVNTVSTLILGDMVSGLYAALGSTMLIVIFGEIIPQAICSRHGLAIGATTSPLMYFFMALTSPLSFPISKFLDFILGGEISDVYGRDKIKELLKNVEGIDEKEFKIITGALDFNKKKVKDVMTPLEQVFMLELNDKLDFQTIANIAGHGFSRIPVYQSVRENIIGLLHVKDFTLLDPDDNMPVKAILEFYNHKIIYCYSDRLIDQMFEEFRRGETHLAFVSEIITPEDRDPYELCVGIITLEDILEELIQMEIYDEFDNKSEIEKNEQLESDDKRLISITEESLRSKSGSVSSVNSLDKKKSYKMNLAPKTGSSPARGNHLELKELANNLKRSSMKKSKEYKQDLAKKLGQQTSLEKKFETQTSHDFSFFIQQDNDNKKTALISTQIRFVMFQFLMSTVKPFTNEFLTRNVLELIIKRCALNESRRVDRKSPAEYLYNYGVGCNYFILVLAGEATIEVGAEKLEFPAGPFTYFGVNALLAGSETAEEVIQEENKLKENESKNVFFNDGRQTKRSLGCYYPDFSLRVDDHCVYMKLDRGLWKKGVIKSSIEKKNPDGHLTDQIEFAPALDNAISNMGSITELETSLNLPSSYQASPISNANLSRLVTGKNSSIVVEALTKAQAKMNKSHSQHKLFALASQDSEDSLLKKSVSAGSLKERKASAEDADDDGNQENGDSEPFLVSEKF